MNTRNADPVKPDLVSKTEFYVNYENSFQVLPDQSTIIGVKFDDHLEKHSVLLQEQLCRESSPSSIAEFGKHKDTINTVLVMQLYKFVFAGDEKGSIAQYIVFDTDKVPQLVKVYANPNIGRVCSSVCVYNLAIFGGSYGKLAFVAGDKQQITHQGVAVATKCARSLTAFQVNESGKNAKLLLAVSGDSPRYSDSKTDLFDISECLRAQGNWRPESVRIESTRSTALNQDGRIQLSKLQKRFDRVKKLYSQLKVEHENLKIEATSAQKKLESVNAKYKQVRLKKNQLKVQVKQLEHELVKKRNVKNKLRKYKKKMKTQSKNFKKELLRLHSNSIGPALKYNSLLTEVVDMQYICGE